MTEEAKQLIALLLKHPVLSKDYKLHSAAPSSPHFLAATMTEEVKQLIALSLKHPVRLAADPTAAAPKDLTQEIVRLKGGQVRMSHHVSSWLSRCRDKTPIPGIVRLKGGQLRMSHGPMPDE